VKKVTKKKKKKNLNARMKGWFATGGKGEGGKRGCCHGKAAKREAGSFEHELTRGKGGEKRGGAETNQSG